MDNLKVISFNVKGIKDPTKRHALMYWLKKKKVDIAYIQEAHCEESTLGDWKEEWGGGNNS